MLKDCREFGTTSDPLAVNGHSSGRWPAAGGAKPEPTGSDTFHFSQGFLEPDPVRTLPVVLLC